MVVNRNVRSTWRGRTNDEDWGYEAGVWWKIRIRCSADNKAEYMEGKDAWRSLRLLRAVAEKKMRGEIMRFSCDQWGLKQEHNKCLIVGLPVETAGVMWDVLILHTLRVFRLTSVSVSLRFEKQWNGRASHDHFCVALLLEMMWSVESQKNYWQRSKGQIKL